MTSSQEYYRVSLLVGLYAEHFSYASFVHRFKLPNFLKTSYHNGSLTYKEFQQYLKV